MKQYSKWIVLLLLLATTIGLLSCNNQKDPLPTDTQPQTQQETQPLPVEPTVYDLIKNNSSEYQIVRSENVPESLKSSIISFRNELESVTKVKLSINSDLLTMSEKGYEEAKEILVGNTAYPESQAALADCGYGEYLIRAVGNKIVIVASDDSSLKKAMSVFSGMVVSNQKEDGSVSFLSTELNIRRSSNAIVSALPVYAGKGETEILDCADNCYMLLAKQCTEQDYNDYCAALQQKGYSLYTSHTANKNRFATYVSDTHTVTMYYAPNRQQIRAMVEEKGVLPATAPAAFTAVTQPSVTMMGMEVDGNQIGLCMIFQLSDGSFVIYDSGNNKAIFADRLYEKLRELALDPEQITIRAWLFSHCHVDHVGAFLHFTEKYRTKVTVENFIYNFSPDAVYDSIVNDPTRGLSAQLRAAVGRWKESNVIKAHTGQKFYFADGVIDILYTGEDIYPAAYRDGNTESLVFRMTLGGQTILCLGDEYTDSSAVLSVMYSNTLKSDILQASHHGRNGATAALNSQISPDTVLWPGGRVDFPELSQRDYNKVLLSICKDLYIAGSDGVTLELPYTVQNNKDAAMK